MYPLAPDGYWWASFLEALANGKDMAEAVAIANFTISPKEFGRFSLTDSHGARVTLSVAVEGGSRQLRDLKKVPQLHLSDHGDWRKVHLGALESLLGRRPFFRDLEPGLKDVYLNPDLQNLTDFNAAIFRVLRTFLMQNIPVATLSVFYNNPVLVARGKEIAREINPKVSALQVFSSIGKESLLGFLALNMV